MKTKIITVIFVALAKLSFGQYDQYVQYVTPYLTDSIRSGFFHFITPNNFQAGQLYQMYRINAPDLNNNMVVIDQHIDSLAGLTHIKYQQTFMNIPIEGAGCIEHYNPQGSLLFINAKVADSINKNHVPTLGRDEVLRQLCNDLKKKDERLVFAWEDEHWETQIQHDSADSSATWRATPELIWAIDTLKDMQLVIPGSRYTLAYKISLTTITPEFETFIYYVDANTGSLLKVRSTHIDVSGDVYGYGNRNLDTKWRGGFIQKYELDAEDWPHNYHTKKWNGSTPWDNMDDTRSNATNWGSTYLTETSTHYHVGNTWDYFYNTFGRNGMNGLGSEIRVKTQWNQDNAYYDEAGTNPDELVFGKTSSSWDLGMEPSIVAHEFAHGVTRYTANLAYEYESGALNESFSDIFGIVVQAQTLDWGSTDWIQGNHIPNSLENTRSMINPLSRGKHWTGNFDSYGNPIYTLGQPDYYQGNNWCACPYVVDKGGVHINSGVQNKWFQALSAGETNPSVQGIGMNKAAQISYYALTSILMSSSQYSDSKEATIATSKILFGECSAEHRATVDAWNHVGIYASYNCAPLSIDDIVDINDVLVYPNPANSFLTIELPQIVENAIQIFDVNGKLVQEIESSGLYFQTDVSLLQNGVYLLHFDFNGQQIVKRIIVQN